MNIISNINIIKQGVLNVVAASFMRLSILAVTYIASQELPTHQFAQIGLILTLINIFSVLGAGGLNILALKASALNDFESINNIKFINKFFISISLIIFITYILYNHKNENDLQIILAQLILITLEVLITLSTAIITGRSNFKSLTKISAISSSIYFISCLIFMNLMEMKGLLIGIIISKIIHLLLLKYIEKKEEKEKKPLRINFSFIQKEALPNLLSGILVPLTIYATGYLIYQEKGDSSFAIFFLCYSLYQLIIFFVARISAPIFNLSLTNYKNKNIHYKSTIFTVLICIFSCFLLFFIVYFFRQYLIDPKFNKNEFLTTLCILLVAAFINSIKISLSRFLVTLSKYWINLIDNTSWALSLMILAYYTQEMGSIGLSLSHLGAYIISLFIAIYISKKNRLF